MTSDEMDKVIQELRDNQVVQGYRLGRTESNRDRLEAMVEQNSQAIAKIADGFILLQAPVTGLSKRSIDFCKEGITTGIVRPRSNGREFAGSCNHSPITKALWRRLTSSMWILTRWYRSNS